MLHTKMWAKAGFCPYVTRGGDGVPVSARPTPATVHLSLYRSAAMIVSLYISTSESEVRSADVCEWSSCPTPFCPYPCPPPPCMMQWESSGVLASWLEPVVEGTPLT